MSSQSRTNARRKRLGAVVVLGAMLGGCSDIYFDRRETIALGADDHIAANRVAQMVDPWPRYVGNKNIAFNGERMQGAVERYRRHEVIPASPSHDEHVFATVTAGVHHHGAHYDSARDRPGGGGGGGRCEQVSA